MRYGILLISCVGLFSLLPTASATAVTSNTEISTTLLAPLFISLAVAYCVRRWFIPQQLKNLQVAFEIDDNLYEVHRITKSNRDTRKLMKTGSVRYGVFLYMMGLTGILMLITELLFDADDYALLNIYIIAVCVIVPVFISPWETLNGQLVGKGSSKKGKASLLSSLRRFITLGLLIAITGLVLLYGINLNDGALTPGWLAYAMLTFMAPTILAYGRILGASWNMLLINKWRTSRGRPNPIDPVRSRFVGRLFSFLLVLFLLTMPITALNGILTVVHVMLSDPSNAEEILNFGGIVGYSIYINIDAISEFLFHWEFIKSLPIFLSFYLSLNIAIVGLAFIFELTRNLILGGQTFGGIFGVTLDSPREIRTEKSAQARQLTFAFAGFSGYTVLLLILVCYKEFGDLMPFTAFLETNGFNEEMRLLTVWLFIGAGQVVFLFTWLLSISKFGSLVALSFDLNPDERREGAVKLEGGDRLQTMVENAAIIEDIDMLIRIQEHEFKGDQALIRQEKARASMWEKALRGMWPQAVEEARKLLAQSGGDNDEARMIVATGFVAMRRLDAAREALHGLQQPEGYDEPEILSFICEWLDPWHGRVSEDDLWDWENNSAIDHLQTLQKILQSWDPDPSVMHAHNDKLTQVGTLSKIALLRAQRRYDDGLDMALELVKKDPTGTRPRIAVALCLIDKGLWHDARSVLDELLKSDGKDPRVMALSAIMGYGTKGKEHPEVALVLDGPNIKSSIMDEIPVNAVAALTQKGGLDEAVNANILVMAHQAAINTMPPRYSKSILSLVFTYLVLIPMWFVLGILVYQEIGANQGAMLTVILLFFHGSYIRLSHQQEQLIRHRDQRGMIKYAKRLRRFKAKPDVKSLPMGTHLLLSGILVTVNGVVLDVGLPAWMTERLEKEPDKIVRQRLQRRSSSIRKGKKLRTERLGKAWWLKRPKEHGESGPALERHIGPGAYRGRTNYLNKKDARQLDAAARGEGLQSVKKFIPHNTIRSEKGQGRPGGVGRPGNAGR